MNRLAIIALLTYSIAAGAQTNVAEETGAVRAVWDEAVAALVAQDWDRYSQVWAHDPGVQVIHPAQRDWATGWQQLEARYRSVISSNVRLEAETRRFEVRVAPSKDVAWATVEAVVAANGIEHTSWQV